jgi:hypothetical protein
VAQLGDALLEDQGVAAVMVYNEQASRGQSHTSRGRRSAPVALGMRPNGQI